MLSIECGTGNWWHLPRVHLLCRFVWLPILFGLSNVMAAAEIPSYEDDVAPILTRYCGGCHTAGEDSGKLSMDDWEALMAGGTSGVAITPGSAESSRLVNVLLGRIEPKMPPEGEPGPNDDEIERLRAWIDGGAPGPDGDSPPRTMPRTAKIPASRRTEPITALAFSPDGTQLAVGRHQLVELMRVSDESIIRSWKDLSGKVECVSFSADGTWVVAGTGITGFSGEAIGWRVDDGSEVLRVGGHRDTLYAATLSRDAKLLATAGYDRRIELWDLTTQNTPAHTITEHNGPIYDLAFSPDGQTLVSASDDATVKVWRVSDGERMDTRGEPLREQYTTAISPNGELFVAGGEDNRIRVWRLLSRTEPTINPMLYARFAHEEAIQVLRFSEEGSLLLSVGKDRLVKLWETTSFRQTHVWPIEETHIQAAAISSASRRVALGGANGKVQLRALPDLGELASAAAVAYDTDVASGTTPGSPQVYQEAEPNNMPLEAQRVDLPAEIHGVIAEPGSSRPSAAASDERATADTDMVRFASLRGQRWVMEVHAASEKSPLDSHIEVLTATGDRVARVELQAVRDSYFTFRGKDSLQTGDFRLHNWEEMRLNQLLYCNGEVVKLYHYPRGPDSGFNVYPNYGNRHGMFDTTPTTHALQETCYIVEPLQPGIPLVPNGLPVFTLFFENDDDALRKAGSDSRLIFTAPHDGDYIVRIADVRGQGGEAYKYRLTIRPPQLDFQPRLTEGANPQVGAGRGRKFGIEIDRLDGFDGPVRLDIVNAPAGIEVTTPLIVESGHLRAWGTVWASPGAAPPANLESEIQIIPSAEINGERREKPPLSLGKVNWDATPKLRAQLQADTDIPQSQGADRPSDELKDGLPVIEVFAGTTATARVKIEREGFAGPVTFGGEDAAWNAPHGVYVSNIGLNGVLIPESENERVVYLAIEPWVLPQDRLMFFTAEQEGNATSNPVWLRVLSGQPANSKADRQ